MRGQHRQPSTVNDTSQPQPLLLLLPVLPPPTPLTLLPLLPPPTPLAQLLVADSEFNEMFHEYLQADVISEYHLTTSVISVMCL